MLPCDEAQEDRQSHFDHTTSNLRNDDAAEVRCFAVEREMRGRMKRLSQAIVGNISESVFWGCSCSGVRAAEDAMMQK